MTVESTPPDMATTMRMGSDLSAYRLNQTQALRARRSLGGGGQAAPQARASGAPSVARRRLVAGHRPHGASRESDSVSRVTAHSTRMAPRTRDDDARDEVEHLRDLVGGRGGAQAEADGLLRRAACRRPSPSARAMVRACPTSTPSRWTRRCPRGRARSAGPRRRCRRSRCWTCSGRGGARAPFTTVFGTDASTPDSSRSRSVTSRGRLARASSRRHVAAAPRPTIPATFSVPARRLRSCRPPVCWGVRVDYRRAPTAPRRPGARRTCARTSTGGRRRARRRPPGSCRPPGRRRCGRARHAREPLAPGRVRAESVPTSLLASITDTSAVSSRSARLERLDLARRRRRRRAATTPPSHGGRGPSPC